MQVGKELHLQSWTTICRQCIRGFKQDSSSATTVERFWEAGRRLWFTLSPILVSLFPVHSAPTFQRPGNLLPTITRPSMLWLWTLSSSELFWSCQAQKWVKSSMSENPRWWISCFEDWFFNNVIICCLPFHIFLFLIFFVAWFSIWYVAIWSKKSKWTTVTSTSLVALFP